MSAHSDIWELERTINRRQEELQNAVIEAIRELGNTTKENIPQLKDLRDALRDNSRVALINNSPILNVYVTVDYYTNTFTGEKVELLLQVVKTIYPEITTIQYNRFNGQSFFKLIVVTPEEQAQLAALKEQEEQERKEQERFEKQKEINVALVRSRIPESRWDEYTFKDFNVVDIDKNHSNKEAYRLARQFAGADSDDENSQDGWHHFLAYIGSPGSGKTRLAFTVGLYLIRHDQTFVRYWQVQDLFETLKSTFNGKRDNSRNHPVYVDDDDDGNFNFTTPPERQSYNEIIQSLKECKTLILDDLGAENDTEWVRSILDMIIDHRYENEMNTIITSNVSDISELSPRIASRFSEGNVCKILMPDFRKIKAVQREKKSRKVASNG